ncbi:NodT family RND efflux system outer membrane lipoprotein [Sulfuricella denitrificans skB26]|uniref:NodT family RND efflux system outer membrane lipoprotein n=1 Tax=Sulfuricella denitrificans (strain DSM 22764 / NBRC 105220 / skB26) TaxID=1163617 RepID=S6ALE6_SULDS|nr:efflux transporter outer membrane subunit [Sulfuricella denitrificans]BAN35509.1 NodT family RND efflux system outer membrane lipoprotein [Sulfuricella denitrificans skB26]
MKKLTGFALPAILLAVLSGCASVGPDYIKPDMGISANWANASTKSDAAQDLSQWWQQLHDPLLSDLIEQSLKASPDLRSAQAKLRESRARRGLAGANQLPTVSASVSESRSKSSAATGSGLTRELYSAGFDASWEPDIFGGTRRALEASQADLEGSEASLHNTQVSLVAEVALNYVELRAFQARLGIARDNLASQSETLELTGWRAEAGLTSSLDVEQARTNREQTRAQIPALETSLAQAEHRLAILLGQAPGTLHDKLAKPALIPTAPDSVAIGIPADTLRQRPDVRVAERRLAAETARIGETTAALYPGFKLSGSIGWEALSFGALGGGDSLARSLLGSVATTLFDGGRIRQRIEIQNAVQEQALVNYEKTVLSALEEVENALVSHANSRKREQALREAADAAHNAVLMAHHRYSTGIIDFQKVLDTERTLLTVQDSLKVTEAESISTLIRLYKALGGGWKPAAVNETPPLQQGSTS